MIYNKFSPRKIHKKIKMAYKTDIKDDSKEEIQIFGEEFVEKNRNKCSLIYKDKEFPFQKYFFVKDIDNEDKCNKKIEILLLEYEDITDRSFMFTDCYLLEELISFKDYYEELKELSENIENYLEDEDIKEKIYSNCGFFEKKAEFYDSNNTSDINSLFESLSTISIKDDAYDLKKHICTNMRGTFYGCSSLLSLPDISKWNIDKANDMSEMFYGCSSLISLPDISNWNTENIEDMSYMFLDCLSLIYLPDISKWNTKKVKYMNSMFNTCSLLKVLTDLSQWNTTNVIDMSEMFFRCSSLISLPNLSVWKTNNEKSMRGNFYKCSSLKSLPDLSKWNTNNIKDMSGMFYSCSSLTSLPDLFKCKQRILLI